MKKEVAEYIASTANHIARLTKLSLDLSAEAVPDGLGEWLVLVPGWEYYITDCEINRETIAATIITAGFEITHSEYIAAGPWDEPCEDVVSDCKCLTANQVASTLVEVVGNCIIRHAVCSVAEGRMMRELEEGADSDIGSKVTVIRTEYKFKPAKVVNNE